MSMDAMRAASGWKLRVQASGDVAALALLFLCEARAGFGRVGTNNQNCGRSCYSDSRTVKALGKEHGRDMAARIRRGGAVAKM
jgi:hypothetical protein